MIELKNVSYTYDENSTDNMAALKNINLTINEGEFIGIAGHTGSGKTTLAQILSGLIRPTDGTFIIDGREYSDYKEVARALRNKVGIVFQYPEHQLFEETVYLDIAFGPKSKGLSEKEIDECVRESAKIAHLDEKLFDSSPFDLSGGQKRRVAIAGVLATQKSVLILDEPCAGLDPAGRESLLRRLRRIRERGKTVVLISHSMEDLASNADRILVLSNGEKIKDGVAGDIFSDYDMLKKSGLEMPEISKILRLLSEGGISIPPDIFNIDEAAKAIKERLGI